MSSSKATSPQSTSRKRTAPLATVVLLLLIVIVLIDAAFHSTADQRRLAPNSTQENGAGALVAILERNGVAVTHVTHDAQLDDITSDSTIVVTDTDVLTEDQVLRVISTEADVIVLVSPKAWDLPLWLDGAYAIRPDAIDVGAAAQNTSQGADGSNDSAPALPANCSDADAQAAKQISIPEALIELDPAYWTSDIGSNHLCFHGAIQGGTSADAPSGDSTAVEASAWFVSPRNPHLAFFGGGNTWTNAQLTQNGNAAFALRKLGKHEHVYWIQDFAQATDTVTTSASAAPRWLTLLLYSGLAVGAWYALYRGRRFGKLVVEPLPVVVPAAETDIGRSRLYTRSKDFAYLSQIARSAFLTKHATRYGYNAQSTSDQVVSALHAHVTDHPEQLRELLFTRDIRTQQDLATLKLELNRLEQELL